MITYPRSIASVLQGKTDFSGAKDVWLYPYVVSSHAVDQNVDDLPLIQSEHNSDEGV